MSEKLDPSKLRKVAGAFATGITVVTAIKPDGSIYGMTANSFLSVSLEPALVMFSVQNTGSLMEYCKVGNTIGISVLAEDQEPISNQFAGFNKEDITVEMEEKDNASVVASAMAWYSTKIDSIIKAGDHHLIICAVVACDRDESKSPLLYFNGYKTLDSNNPKL